MSAPASAYPLWAQIVERPIASGAVVLLLALAWLPPLRQRLSPGLVLGLSVLACPVALAYLIGTLHALTVLLAYLRSRHLG